MKKIVIIMLFTVLGLKAINSYGTENQGILISYEMILNFNSQDRLEGELSFNSSCAYFKFHRLPKDTVSDNEDSYSDNLSINITDTTSIEIFTDKIANKTYETVVDQFTKESFLIKENLDTIDWKITNEVKHIGNFKCNKATCHYKGRNYTVWFTMDIPCSFGPWKLHGLPGAVIYVCDDREEVFFSAKQINYNIQFEWQEPCDKQISRKEYQKILADQYVDMVKKVMSKSSQRFDINISVPKQYGIEIDEK